MKSNAKQDVASAFKEMFPDTSVISAADPQESRVSRRSSGNAIQHIFKRTLLMLAKILPVFTPIQRYSMLIVQVHTLIQRSLRQIIQYNLYLEQQDVLSQQQPVIPLQLICQRLQQL